MDKKSLKAFNILPPPSTFRIVDFDKAEVVPGFVSDTFFLIVSGTKPYANMKVELHALIYIDKPDYWGIEVIGYLPCIGLPHTAPYTVALDITHIRGKSGVEVIGATKKQKIKVS